MREIIFRAKVKDKDELIGKGFPIDENGNPISEWVYGVPTPIPGYPDLFTAWNVFNDEYEEITVITETIGQYTGLTDKNGKKVFEGDIIRYCERFDYQMYQESIEDPEAYDGELYSPAFSIGAVVYYTDVFSGFDISNHNFDSNGLSELICSGDYFYEVIGNIHDNPELLTDSN